MRLSSDVLSGSQELLRKVAQAVFLLSLSTLALYVAGSLNDFTDDSLAMLLAVTGYASAVVVISAGMHVLILVFAFLLGMKKSWKSFIVNVLLAFFSGAVLAFVSFVLVVHGGMSFG